MKYIETLLVIDNCVIHSSVIIGYDQGFRTILGGLIMNS